MSNGLIRIPSEKETKIVRIANPIYDVVFKYLMEDRESAILLLSELIGEDIAELDFHPQERTAEIAGKNRFLSVYRIDFAAKIRLNNGGYRKVVIEIQKAKFSSDIMRFRRYLGEQYRNGENIYRDEEGAKRALPIITVYFLGHRLSNTDSAVIKVKRAYNDGISGEELKDRDEFIESLTHDSGWCRYRVCSSRIEAAWRSCSVYSTRRENYRKPSIYWR